MVSFLINPTREATAPDGSQWEVRLVRGNAWRGWPGQERLLQLPSPLDPMRSNRRTQLIVHSLPLRGLLWLAYRLQRRTDYRVVVRPFGADSDREAVRDERHPTKEAAAARASEVLHALRQGSDW
ncbi:hypothetical protein [Jannaschia sp. R86511]|uniref:hypothetical protein n=1 Tax=Jannaschia sp. R86511 TaxID=3093853 RepID=UPI0036D2F53F